MLTPTNGRPRDGEGDGPYRTTKAESTSTPRGTGTEDPPRAGRTGPTGTYRCVVAVVRKENNRSC